MSSGTSSGSSQGTQSSRSEDDLNLQAQMEKKRKRRKESNRESARRSRMRKQQHLDELTSQVYIYALLIIYIYIYICAQKSKVCDAYIDLVYCFCCHNCFTLFYLYMIACTHVQVESKKQMKTEVPLEISAKTNSIIVLPFSKGPIICFLPNSFNNTRKQFIIMIFLVIN